MAEWLSIDVKAVRIALVVLALLDTATVPLNAAGGCSTPGQVRSSPSARNWQERFATTERERPGPRARQDRQRFLRSRLDQGAPNVPGPPLTVPTPGIWPHPAQGQRYANARPPAPKPWPSNQQEKYKWEQHPCA